MNARDLVADFAVFLHSPGGGGAQRRTIALVNGFVESGYEVDLVVVSAHGPLRASLDPRVRVVELAPSRVRNLFARLPRRVQLFATVPALALHLRRCPSPVFLAAASHVHLPALLARRASGRDVAMVLRLSNHLTRRRADGSGPGRRGPARFLARLLYHDARGVVAVSRDVADDLVSATGFPRERIEAIPNPVVSPDHARRADAPLAHPWFQPGAPPVILGVGRLVRQKDFATLLRAFARVRERMPARLVLLGKAGRESRRVALLELAGRLGVASDVELAGWVDDPSPYMRRAALLASSSAWEGSPGVLIEALACGCPVVSTDCPGGAAEILEDGRYGRLVPVGDDRALADAIVETLASPLPRALLESRAAGFGVERAVARYLAFLLRAGGRGDRASTQPAPALVEEA